MLVRLMSKPSSLPKEMIHDLAVLVICSSSHLECINTRAVRMNTAELAKDPR